jgi:SAM-dependent methyltransferase
VTRRDPTRRFSDRVSFYDAHRPSYPVEVPEVLAAEGFLPPGAEVADLGAGTGKLSRILLDAGHRVIAVEPNAAMLADCARLLGEREGFRGVEGRAEATGLADGSVDLVTAAQAFHWFDPAACGRECRRILREGGGMAILWNVRRVDATPFMAAYEALLAAHGTDYHQVSHRGLTPEALDRLFGPGRHRVRKLRYRQPLDREGLRGRLASASYLPAPGDPGYEALEPAIEALFEAHREDGRVTLEYDTVLYLGRFT